MSKQQRSEESGGRLPATRGVEGDRPDMRDWAEQLVARARSEGVELTGDGGLLTAMVREVLQTGLEVEMAEHLGYEPHDPAGRNSGNSRNGSYPKTVITEIGEVDVRVPRDRNGSFSPVTVPKHQRRLEGLGAAVLSLYARNMTTGDIQSLSSRSMGPTSRARRSRRSPIRSSQRWWRGRTGRWIAAMRCC
jgi:putative transposase